MGGGNHVRNLRVAMAVSGSGVEEEGGADHGVLGRACGHRRRSEPTRVAPLAVFNRTERVFLDFSGGGGVVDPRVKVERVTPPRRAPLQGGSALPPLGGSAPPAYHFKVKEEKVTPPKRGVREGHGEEEVVDRVKRRLPMGVELVDIPSDDESSVYIYTPGEPSK